MPPMAHDDALADRIRGLLATESRVTEQRMFGGVAFLVKGHMALAVSGQGGVLVRVDPETSEALIATGRATLMVMRGRRMLGWVRVAPEHLRTKAQLAAWVRRGVERVRTLPGKSGRAVRSTRGSVH